MIQQVFKPQPQILYRNSPVKLTLHTPVDTSNTIQMNINLPSSVGSLLHHSYPGSVRVILAKRLVTQR